VASILSLLVVFGFGGAAWAANTTYYVDAVGGSDAGSGTSEAGAWRTVGRANAQNLEPGDKVLFRAGQSFSGTVEVYAEDAGTPENPVVVGSYGGGRARISAGTGKAVSVYNAGGVEMRDLNVVGVGHESGSRASGIEIYTDLGGTRKLEYIRVANVEASGFGDAGVILGAYPADGTKSGFRDVRITNVEAHGNADAGIESYGYYSGSPGGSPSGWAHEDVYVGHSRAYDNLGVPNKGNNSGNGIVLGDVNRAVVERNVAYNNGERNNHSGGGPVGIWAWESNAVTIQYNESYGNETGTIDGGGFDLDGGVTNSVMQYNYSHDNGGAGYLLYQFSGARPFNNNVVRYNVSQNDGRTNLGGIYGGGGAADTEVYNNTIFTSPRSGGQTFAVKVDGTRDFRFHNNVFVTTGGTTVAEVAGSNSGLLFAGNEYWSSGGAFAIRQGGATYASLAGWRSATGQERYDSRDVGLSVDPQLTSPGGGGTVGDATKLGTLSAYRLRAGSPLVDAGVGLGSLGITPGPTDFYGTITPQRAGYDVGAHEYPAQTTTQSPQPAPGPTPTPPPNTAPTISSLRPAPGSSTRDRTPVVRATVRDAQTNLGKSNIRLYVDGRRKTTFSYDRSTDRLKYASGRLDFGRHTVKVVAVDGAGLGESRTWRFGVKR